MTDLGHWRYAGLVSRLAALTVDAALLAVAVSMIVSGLPVVWETLTGTTPGWVQGTAGVVGALLPVVYFAGCWWMTGQTVGGLLLGTVVRRSDGRHLGVVRAALRSLVGLLLPVLWLIGMISVLWDGRRRALHDRLFGTVVLYTVPRGSIRRLGRTAQLK